VQFERRHFLQLLAATGAALVVPKVGGPTGPGTLVASELTAVVYPPSPEAIATIDNLVEGGVGARVYHRSGGW
jgi:hypothetical protein